MVIIMEYMYKIENDMGLIQNGNFVNVNFLLKSCIYTIQVNLLPNISQEFVTV